MYSHFVIPYATLKCCLEDVEEMNFVDDEFFQASDCWVL
jgi:hypothetical protein